MSKITIDEIIEKVQTGISSAITEHYDALIAGTKREIFVTIPFANGIRYNHHASGVEQDSIISITRNGKVIYKVEYSANMPEVGAGGIHGASSVLYSLLINEEV